MPIPQNDESSLDVRKEVEQLQGKLMSKEDMLAVCDWCESHERVHRTLANKMDRCNLCLPVEYIGKLLSHIAFQAGEIVKMRTDVRTTFPSLS